MSQVEIFGLVVSEFSKTSVDQDLWLLWTLLDWWSFFYVCNRGCFPSNLLKWLCLLLISIKWVIHSGTTGIVDYTSYDDMKYAVCSCCDLQLISIYLSCLLGELNMLILFLFWQIKKLDDTEFKNAFSRSYIRVRLYLPLVLSLSLSLYIDRPVCVEKVYIYVCIMSV